MFGKKPKTEQPQLRERRARTTQTPNPAFSYYTSRTFEITKARPEPRAASTEQGKAHSKVTGQLPLLLFAVVAVICVAKLLLLGTDPKVILLGRNDISASYLRSNATYETAAEKLLAGSVTSDTKITVNLDGTATAMKKEFPELQDVSVTLPLIGNRPIVYAEAAQPSVIVQSVHGNFALNKSGLVLASVSRLPSGVPLLVDQSGVTVHPGQQYLPGSTINFIQTLSYQFTAAKLSVAAYVLPQNSPYELDVRLEGKSFVVRCNLASDALTQSGAAIATLQQLGGTTPSAYLDVRVPGRVYYK